jgi:hypothetical protein
MAVRFYHRAYDTIMTYHSNLRGYGMCSCCVKSRAKRELEQKMDDVFDDFLSSLSSHQSTGLIDDI